MHNHSYENEFNLHVNEISFSYERMSTKTRFEKEAKGNSEMAYSIQSNAILFNLFSLILVTQISLNEQKYVIRKVRKCKITSNNGKVCSG